MTDVIGEGPFISAEDVASWQQAGRDVAILAILSDADGDRPLRIEGAIDVDLASELAGPGGGTQGARPLPALEDLQQTARRWGVNDGTTIVAYDNGNGFAAARAWWTLKWAGARQVYILDGGLGAWTRLGLPVSRAHPKLAAPGNILLKADNLPVLDADEAARLAETGKLFDARAENVFSRGHIPGAINFPAARSRGTDGRLLPVVRLRETLWPSFGEDVEVGVYCGSGVSAAYQIAALAALGRRAALYPGSWSAWSADPGRPVQIGVSD
ncbi:sulfurtransferase [Rhizobium puerariae]|uniref:Sulfurtransferase n=1 Tax=Rhizobium puerariae TaxID=1585791 RepID=A0ABV6AMR0_9HYPH